MYIKYLRIGDINIDVTTSGFPFNITNYQASIDPFIRRGVVLDWYGLILHIEQNVISSIIKNTATKQINKLGNLMNFVPIGRPNNNFTVLGDNNNSSSNSKYGNTLTNQPIQPLTGAAMQQVEDSKVSRLLGVKNTKKRNNGLIRKTMKFFIKGGKSVAPFAARELRNITTAVVCDSQAPGRGSHERANNGNSRQSYDLDNDSIEDSIDSDEDDEVEDDNTTASFTGTAGAGSQDRQLAFARNPLLARTFIRRPHIDQQTSVTIRSSSSHNTQHALSPPQSSSLSSTAAAAAAADSGANNSKTTSNHT